MTLAILLIGLVIATCFIAYIADNIGKNMGKKRISIFGLRPRQTATLISMASSVGIMLLTVVILLLTSQSLSNALLRYDAEKREANRQRKQNEQLQQERQELLTNLEEQRGLIKNQLAEIAQNRSRAEQSTKQRRQVEAQLQGASTRLAAARKGEASARVRAQEAQKRLDSAQRRFETFKTQLAGAQAQVVAATGRVQQAQSQVKKTQAQLKGEQQQVALARTRLEVARRGLIAARSELDDAQREQKAATTLLARAQRDLKEAEGKYLVILQSVRENLAQLKKVASENADLEAQRGRLQVELDAQQQALVDLKRQAERYKSYVNQIGTGDIATPQGEVFAEQTIPSTVSSAQALAALSRLMEEARAELADPPRTLQLVLPTNASHLSEEEFLNGFAAYLSTYVGRLGVPVSVRLAAARDHARGENEIFAQLVPIEIRTVFRKSDVLASIPIEPGGDARVFNQLLTLLNQAERRARDRGVTPLLTAQNPLFYPTGTNEQVFEALRKVQAAGGNVTVQLVAADDVTTVDSPRVRFEIVSRPSGE